MGALAGAPSAPDVVSWPSIASHSRAARTMGHQAQARLDKQRVIACRRAFRHAVLRSAT